MKVTHIVASMMTILALLFIFAPIFRKREVEKTKLEREYFSLLEKYKSNNSSEILDEIITLGTKLFKISDREQVKNLIEEDLTKLGA